MTQTATRPVTIDELQRAWRAVQAGQFRSQSSRPGSAQVETGAAAAAARWAPDERVLPVLGCHPQAGASTLAVAIATAAAPARVLECASASATGLAMAATAELGSGPGGWRLGRRGQVELARAGDILDAPSKVPLPEPPVGQIGLSVLDVGWEIGQLMATSTWVRETVTEATHVIASTTATIPGFRRLEIALDVLAPADPVVAVLGAPLRRWPRHLQHSLGPKATQARDAGRLHAIPLDRSLAERGLSGGPIPTAVFRAAEALLEQLAPGLHPTEGTPQ